MASLFYKWLIGFSILFADTGLDSKTHLFPATHPFFISVTEMNHNSAEQNLEVSCKIFTDDFETVLSKAYKSKVDLISPANKEKSDKFIADYINRHLIIKLDGRPVKLEFVGFEREEEAVWSYFQVQKTQIPKRIEVTNNILYDAFDTQINIMHVSVGGTRRSSKVVYPQAVALFEF